jgi:hypothetical protein
LSSQAEQDTFIEGLREDGILDELNASLGRAEAEAPAEAETAEEPEVEAPAEEPEGEEPEATPEAEPEVEPEPEPEPEPEAPAAEVDYIELAPETEEYLAKYGGDVNEALKAAANAQSLIGRQGNELGEVRQELNELREALMQQQQYQAPQPYRTILPDPEEADEEELIAAYSSIAHEAIERADAATLQQAVEAWGELQPFQASQFLSRLQQQAYVNELAALQAQDTGNALAAQMEELQQRHPDLASRVEEIGQEAQRSPALGRLLREDVDPATRANALEELYLRVANRQTSETSQQALRRVAVKQSEEARRARQGAQVASSGRGSVAEPDAKPHLIPLGRTGRSVDLNRVDEILKSDRI